MQRREINAADGAPPAGAYTQAVEITGAARTLYLSGQVGADTKGNVPDDVGAQARLVWANLQAQLRAAGMTLDNLVKLTTIVTDVGYRAETGRIRMEVLGDRKPASTLIVGGLATPAYKIEIEAIACA
jgi:2-iminobutanoate/2-iminopropanoate deaminase